MRYFVAIGVAFLIALILAMGGQWRDSVAQITPLPSGRVIMVAENLDIPAQAVTTVFFDTDDCRTVAVFVDATTAITVYARPSIFGNFAPARVGGNKHSRVQGQSVTFFGEFLVAPMLAIEFERGDTIGSDTVNGAWLFCTH